MAERDTLQTWERDLYKSAAAPAALVVGGVIAELPLFADHVEEEECGLASMA